MIYMKRFRGTSIITKAVFSSKLFLSGLGGLLMDALNGFKDIVNIEKYIFTAAPESA